MAKGRAKRKIGAGDVASNRYASHRYELIERLECGIVLEGTEVKALRASGAQLKDGYAAMRDGELWLHSVHIPPYGPASRENHEPERVRKLLLHRRELDRIAARANERGLTLVPTRIYFSGSQRQGRDRARPRQGPLRQAPVHPRAGDQAGHGTGRSRSPPLDRAEAVAAAGEDVRLVHPERQRHDQPMYTAPTSIR